MSRRGAEFRKADFQIHSPRDTGWEGERPEDSLPAPTEEKKVIEARRKWAKEFIDKCLKEGLRAIAITDHHEGVYAYEVINYLKDQEAIGVDLGIWVFPGMEVTLRDSCQALLIFDADFPRNYYEKARLILGLPTDVRPLEKQGIQVEPINRNIEDIQDLLAADKELENKFIILPHVKPDGHKTMLRTGFHIRFRDMPYVGGYMDRMYLHELKAGDQRILLGEIPAWSSERRGVISTSDSRYADFRLIGKHASWVKMAAPTAESIRQAMLAADSRLRDQEPRLPKVVIERVEIKGSTYLQPAIFEFNQQLNVIIGGRGAGKSTILEYIRFGLGCSALDEKDPTDPSTIRMKNLLKATLGESTGEVVISVLLNGTPVTISRSMAAVGAIKIEQGGTFNLVSPGEVRSLIPTQSFRQGELSELASDQAAQRLLDLVTADEREQIRRIELDLKGNGADLSECLSKVLRFASAQGRAKALLAEEKLVSSQIGNLQKQITPEDQTARSVINDHGKFESEKNKTDDLSELIEGTLGRICNEIVALIKSLRSATQEDPSLDVPELKAIYQAIHALISDGSSEIPVGMLHLLSVEMAAKTKEIVAKFGQFERPWIDLTKQHEVEYQKQTALLIGQEATVAELTRLMNRSQQIKKESEQANLDLETLKNSTDTLAGLRQKQRKLQEDLDRVVGQQAVRIEAASAGFARGKLAEGKQLDEMRAALAEILTIPHIREARVESVAQQVTAAQDPRSAWNGIVNELLALLLWKEGPSEELGERPNAPILHKCLEDTFLERLVAKLKTEDVAIAMKVVMYPLVEIFQRRGTSEVEFRLASQGEQAATLLNILMNQAAGPLLIDQPEGDLDNRIINEVIKTISRTKDERQLLLATHNANITVNADSELVTELQLGAKLNVGAIDEPSVRMAITDTIEGGKDAFELRRKKYNF